MTDFRKLPLSELVRLLCDECRLRLSVATSRRKLEAYVPCGECLAKIKVVK